MRIGFIIDSSIPSWNAVKARKAWPHHLLFGWDTKSPMALMRYGWIARDINARRLGVRYELYRPWRKYAAVVFVKSMGAECQALAAKLKAQGIKVLFDINVDYFTPASGTFYFKNMAPAEGQRQDALAMAQAADAVLCASSHLAKVCAPLHASVTWVPDNVRLDLVPPWQSDGKDKTLHLWWSGEPVKLFELLLIEAVLRKFKDRIHLHLVTRSFKALDRWEPELKPRFLAMLKDVPHTRHRFRSVPHLMELYRRGPGLTLSPRYLDNSYNQGHTEWKITLAMACGLPALVSPVPSYKDVAGRCGEGAIAICETEADWERHLEGALDGSWNLERSAAAARKVVGEFYSTPVVAAEHLAAVRACLGS